MLQYRGLVFLEMEDHAVALDTSELRAVAFDYGNTLIPYGPDQVRQYGEFLAEGLRERLGPFDEAAYWEFRRVSRMAPYGPGNPNHEENDLRQVTVRLVETLYERPPTGSELDALMEVRHKAFLSALRVEPEVVPFLARLRERYALGFVSNYPDAPAIRASLEAHGLAPYFSAVVISGELGLCKPHPLLFASVLHGLGGLPSRAVAYVGDNWLADVQGAKRVGMAMVRMTRWPSAEAFAPQPGDHEPDAVVDSLSALEALLLA